VNRGGAGQLPIGDEPADHGLDAIESLLIDVHEGQIDILERFVGEEIADQAACETVAAGSDKCNFGHGIRPFFFVVNPGADRVESSHYR